MSGSALAIGTWNVLHRVHAENHAEPVVERWPDEAARVAAIAARIASTIASGASEVVCLQEVSSALRDALDTALAPTHTLHAHTYPRVPRFRVATRTTLADAREHLVILAPRGATTLHAETFSKDPGKGALVVAARADAVVIATHVSAGARGPAQLDRLAALVAEHRARGLVVVAGDFNTDAERVSAALGVRCAMLDPAGGPTRRFPTGLGGHDIDHLVAHGGRWRTAVVEDGGALSDHQPVRGVVELDA